MDRLIIRIFIAALGLVTLSAQAEQSGVVFLSTNTSSSNPGKLFCNVRNAPANIQVSLANHDVVLQGIQSGGLLSASAAQLKQFYLTYYYKNNNDPLGPHINYNLVNAPPKISITCIANSTGGRPQEMPSNFNVATIK